MNIEELRRMSESELRSKADAALADIETDTLSDQTKGERVAQAQFYLAEIERRDSARIARRDFWMEIAVIILIGLELILGYCGGKQQMEVLTNLNKSSGETAQTLAAVRQAQEASLDTQKHTLENITGMNNSLRDEMDLNFANAMQFSGGSSEEVFVYNAGRVTLFLWGSKFDGQPPSMQQRGIPITFGARHTFDISHVTKGLLAKMEEGSHREMPFELYLKAENGTKYLAKSTLMLTRQKSNLMIWCDLPISTTRKEW